LTTLRILPLLLVLLAAAPALADTTPKLQLVESVPVETNWDTRAPNTQEAWVALFDGAKNTIDMAQFYLAHKPGQALDPVLAALRRAASRGVKVRILAEKGMADESADTLQDLGSHPNISWAWFDISVKTDGIIHAKYMVVDTAIVFMGSQNFDWRALEHIHELGVRIVEPSVAAAFQLLFNLDWVAMKSDRWDHTLRQPDRDHDGLPDGLDPAPDRPMCKPGNGPIICPVFAPPSLLPAGFARSLSALLELLDGANNTIDIQLMTYDIRDGEEGKWTVLDEALRRAAKRGVKIRMNIADWSLKPPRIDFLKSLQQVENISVRINAIPEWSGGYLPYSRVDHSKYMVVDNRIGWVGTSNWGKGYFDSVRAVEVYFDDPATTGQLAAIFELGWSGPYAFDLEVDREYPLRKHD
jgi:phosphatidylserine/phosphatidylglycerophosphate/cardiolipin synthase-like enzyme